jgi:AraC-like DNA-binding protein
MKQKRMSALKVADFERLSEKVLAPQDLHRPTEHFASELGYTRTQLNHLFQRHCGCSLTALRLERRLLEAANLLRESGAVVKTVAERCGFNHHGLFSLCFERRFGVSPSEWSRNSRA